jgi:hypothetical protein
MQSAWGETHLPGHSGTQDEPRTAGETRKPPCIEREQTGCRHSVLLASSRDLRQQPFFEYVAGVQPQSRATSGRPARPAAVLVCVKLPGVVLRCDHTWAAWEGLWRPTVLATFALQALTVRQTGGQDSGSEYLAISHDE